MKTIPITVHTLSAQTPQENFLPSHQVHAYLQQEHLLKQAQAIAQEKQDAAQKILEEARTQAQEIRHQAQEDAQAQAYAQQETVKQEIIAETLQWLVQEEHMEKTIVLSLEKRIREQVSHAFHQVTQNLDLHQLLIHRLQTELEQLTSDQTYLLRVPSQELNIFEKKIRDHQLEHRLQIITDEQLRSHETILETPFFLLKVDISGQIEQIFHYLRTGLEPPLHE